MNWNIDRRRFSIVVACFGLFEFLLSAPARATTYNVVAGETLTIKGSYNSSDPNDPDENEPLVVNAGACSFQTFGTRSCAITFAQAGTFDVTASIQGRRRR
jgi:hypothetical protein